MDKAKERKVFEIFQQISARYDRSNDRISLGFQKSWKKYLINDVINMAKPNSKILDLCSGTGDIGIAIAKKRCDVNVIGADFSPNMLGEAREKSKDLSNISFALENACALSYKDSSFDIVTISFGLRNTRDYQKVLGEIKRVLKKGGFIICLDSFVPDNIIVRPFYKLYFKYLMPVIGGGISKIKAYRWLYQSTKDFLKKSELIDLYKKIGFTNIESKSLMFGACLLIKGKKV
ncbi:MAG: ubiquinone/menaquinone biosynthesis methyltransferase [Peptoniphilaceae bacterium]|nr:ubiquinone/menaquinone biosynthesis methyltransferase [Peptoniphilaceae bacterium]MDY6019731.1 ubiquinone/menaquinone biosynthesis methyltransferase [Anaerococcus sp.]